jgi:hypothetical protein
MGYPPSKNIWRLFIDKFGLSEMSEKKLGPKRKGELQRRGLA